MKFLPFHQGISSPRGAISVVCRMYGNIDLVILETNCRADFLAGYRTCQEPFPLQNKHHNAPSGSAKPFDDTTAY